MPAKRSWIQKALQLARSILFRNTLAYTIRIAFHLLSWPTEKLCRLFVGLKFKHIMFTYDYSYKPAPRQWDSLPTGNIYRRLIAENDPEYALRVREFAAFADKLQSIPADAPPNDTTPRWNNNEWLDEADAFSIYCFLAMRNPEIYLEVGSGNSTLFARRAVSDLGLRTKIVSIDPFPRCEVDAICDKVVRNRLEEADLSDFYSLRDGDVLFVDCSHRSFPSSDVTVFFTEILPFIPKGVLWGVHDIFLPFDYPEEWTVKEERWYNEQYLLMAYLLNTVKDELYFPTHYVAKCHPEYYTDFTAAFSPRPPWLHQTPQGAGFWMQRKA